MATEGTIKDGKVKYNYDADLENGQWVGYVKIGKKVVYRAQPAGSYPDAIQAALGWIRDQLN